MNPGAAALDNDELEEKWRFKTTGFTPFLRAVDIFQPMITIEKIPRGRRDQGFDPARR
jgi:hypothetical protein